MELTNKDLQTFYSCSRSTADHRKKEILKAFGLPTNKRRVLLLHLAKYEGLSIDECKQVLNLYKNGNTS